MKRVGELVAGVLTTALILAAFMLLGWLACGCQGPQTTWIPVPAPGQPACVVVLGPPPSPPMSFTEMSRECRDPEGRQLPDEAWCLTAAQAREMFRFAAQAHLFAVSAYHACKVSDEGTEPGARTFP